MWWKGCFIFASCMIAFQTLQAPNLECGLGTRVVVAVQPRPPPRAFPSLAGSGGPRLWTWTDPCLSMSSMGFCSPGLSCRLTIPYFRCVSWCAFGRASTSCMTCWAIQSPHGRSRRESLQDSAGAPSTVENPILNQCFFVQVMQRKVIEFRVRGPSAPLCPGPFMPSELPLPPLLPLLLTLLRWHCCCCGFRLCWPPLCFS